jgi:DNA-binding MarR family transcriptional regulator
MRFTPEDTDAALTWTLTRAARNLEHRLTLVISEFGLSPVQMGVLIQLETYGQLTRAELARLTLTTPQSMSGVIESMVAKGLIEMRGEGGRGRPNPVRATAEGQRLIEELWPSFIEANSAGALGLTEAEAASLNATLHRLRQL